MRKYNKKYHPFFIGLVCLSSCSPLRLTPPVQKIYITTAKNVKVVLIDGSQPARFARPAKSKPFLSFKQFLKLMLKAERKSKGYFVTRSDQPLVITLQIDSTRKTVSLPPHKNAGRFLNMKYVFRSKDSLDTYAYKRWIYPRKNLVTVNDTAVGISRFEPVQKGTVKMSISAPISIFSLKNDTGRYNSAGIIGIELGADYYYHEHRFLSIAGGAATDVLPVDYFGYRETGTALYASIRNNMVSGRFDAGYGLSLQRFKWERSFFDSSMANQSVKSTVLGLSISANYRVFKNLRAGILYQPGLLQLSHGPVFNYQHYMSIHLTWNFASGRSVLKSTYTHR